MTEARKKGFWRHARPIAAVSALVAVGAISGCADEEELPADTGNGGTAGTGTGGGASGKGGSGGTAGAAGKGGTAGTGGAGAGGAGAGGSSGKGGAGGAGTGGGGSSGKGGTGGGGTGGGGTGGGGSSGKGGGGTGGGGTGGGGTGGGGTGGGTSCPVVTGDGTLATKTKLADGGTTFVSPFDAVPSPDGSTVYFTAIDVASGKGAVYSVPAAGGTVTTIAVGMVAPTGIAVSGDGKTLYVADEAGAEDAADFTKDAGLFYTVGTAANSTPTVAAKGGRPHSVTVAHDASCKDVVYVGTYSGDTPTISTFAAGAFTTAVTTKFEASGIAAAADGTLYWVETVGGPWASIQTAKAGGAGTLVTAGLYVGYPAGLALSPDGKNLVLSALAPADGTDSLVKLDTAGKTLTQQQPATDKTTVEAAGMHRALDANVFAFVDGLGSTGTGAVYLVKPLGRGLSWRIRNEDCKLRIGRARGAGCDRYRGDGECLEPP